MQLFNQATRITPVDRLTKSEAELRIKLSREEQIEFEDSLLFEGKTVLVDRVEALDALADRMYILFGDALTLGLGLYLPLAFRKVHESNMSKLWTQDEVLTGRNGVDENEYVVKQLGTKTDRKYLVTNSIGKVVKSPSYMPADLGQIFDELDGQELLDFSHATSIWYGDAPEPDCEENALFIAVDEFEDEERES